MLKYTGSQFEGEMMDNLPHGKGIYKFPNGTIYEGNFFKGNFHGKGKLKYPGKGQVNGVWENGKLIEKTYQFSDNLNYKPEQWEYCNLSDRRFNNERNQGLKPFGQQNLCDKNGVLKIIPEGTYDIQKGFLDPNRKLVYNYDQTQILYKANEDQVKNYVEKYKYTAQKQFIDRIDGVFQKEQR